MRKPESTGITMTIVTPVWQNLLRTFVYFSLIFLLISYLYGENLNEFLYDFFFIRTGAIPDIFKTVLVCSALFLIFTTAVSAIAATREQNHFKTSLMIRLLLFVINVLPIALFQYVLLARFGFRIIYFVIVYLFVQIATDILKSVISTKIKNNAIPIIIRKVISEILAVGISIFLVNNIPLFPHSANMRLLDIGNLSNLTAVFLYIVLFNSITFFTVEYCINVFRDEYKKNYIKYYFLFNRNIFFRIWYTLKNAMPQVLEKIRKNLSWLVMFIIIVESTFENNTVSVGYNLVSGYIDYDAIVLIRNIFYLLMVMFLINTCFDIIITFFQRYDNHRDNDDDTKDDAAGVAEPKEKNSIGKKINAKTFIKIAVIVFIGIVYFLSVSFNQREYAFAGYYDFESNQRRTLGMFLEASNIKEDSVHSDIIEQYKNAPLCEQKGNPTYYSILQLVIESENGDIIKVIPAYDNRQRYFFIQENRNMQGLYDISFSDRIVSVERIDKYQSIAFTNAMTSFSLSADRNVPSSTKPLYLILPFYLSYFMTLLIVVITIVCCIYFAVSRFYFSRRLKSDKKIIISGKIFNQILSFLNTVNIVVVFILINLAFRQLRSGGADMTLEWENQTFIINLLSYFLIQILITIMFSDSYISEITLYLKRMRNTDEYTYYNLIGMSNERQYQIFNKKYGHNLLLKLIFQNIMFVLNINWFMAYAFNAWRSFTDFIGVTYAISFENIFTKIIQNQSVRTDMYNFAILIVVNVILFGCYYYYQKKLKE